MAGADLDTALAFVSGRIKEEATRSAEPLNDEQLFLLNHLPEHSASPPWYGADPEFPVLPTPRNTAYERLCALAKAAHQNDLRVNPPSSLDWQFAAAVSKLNRHPISILLSWAGVKVRRPWWDRWLLVVAALVFVLFAVALMLLAGDEPWTRFQWAIIGAGYVAMLLLLHYAARRIEEGQLRNTIENCRT